MTEMGLSVGGRSSNGLEESGSCASGQPEIHVAVKSNIFFYDLEDVLALKSALSIFPDALVGLKISLNSESRYERKWQYALITVELIQACLRTKKSAARVTT
jgi:hypothetical protein